MVEKIFFKDWPLNRRGAFKVALIKRSERIQKKIAEEKAGGLRERQMTLGAQSAYSAYTDTSQK